MSKENSKIIHNDNNDNHYSLIESEIVQIAPLKDVSEMVQCKNDSKYISSKYVDKLQNNFLKLLKLKQGR